jgi:hypothetical protein
MDRARLAAVREVVEWGLSDRLLWGHRELSERFECTGRAGWKVPSRFVERLR